MGNQTNGALLRAALAGALLLPAADVARGQDAPLDEAQVRELVREVRELRATVQRLDARVRELEGGREEAAARDDALAAAIADLGPAAAPLPAAAPDGGAAGFSLSGTFEALYSYNPRADGRTLGANRFRAGDADANTFSLQTIQLVVERQAESAGDWGLLVQAEYGKLAELIDPPGDLDGGADDAFSVSEVHAGIRTAGLLWDTDLWQIGRFQSPLGYESNENRKNVMVTRNPIYQLGTPTTHTGVRGIVAIAPDLSATVYLVNGWDDQLDADTGKTAIVSLASTEIADWWGSAFTLNGSFGHEGSDDGHLGDKTAFGELTWTTAPSESFGTVLDLIAGSSEDAIPRPGRSAETRTWHGAAGYATYAVADDTDVSGRAGYYSDDRFRLGRMRLLDVSIAVRHRLTEGLTLLLEIRHDWSPDGRPYRTRSGGATDEQDTVTASVLVEF